MSWTTDIDRADQFRQRHSWHAPTAVYRAVVTPDAVLLLLERRGEGPPEVVLACRLTRSAEPGVVCGSCAGVPGVSLRVSAASA
jgi:hypothetical protein